MLLQYVSIVYLLFLISGFACVRPCFPILICLIMFVRPYITDPYITHPYITDLKYSLYKGLLLIPWVAAQAVRWSGIPKVARSRLSQCSKSYVCSPARIAVCNTWSSGGTALCRVGGATSQWDLPSLTPLSVAGCGWLQLGAPHWATSVNYCK